jgi:hypothetical protein
MGKTAKNGPGEQKAQSPAPRVEPSVSVLDEFKGRGHLYFFIATLAASGRWMVAIEDSIYAFCSSVDP